MDRGPPPQDEFTVLFATITIGRIPDFGRPLKPVLGVFSKIFVASHVIHVNCASS